jgi:hypothetical protein
MCSTKPRKSIKRNSRARSGQAFVELCAALIILVPIMLTMLDCGFIFLGASLNDFICRDAARAAASGPPSVLTPGAPNQRALTVIHKVYFSNLPMKVRDAIDLTESINDVPPASMGGGVDGQMSVATTIDIYPPFLVSYLGNGKVVLTSRHTVPITYVRPAS